MYHYNSPSTRLICGLYAITGVCLTIRPGWRVLAFRPDGNVLTFRPDGSVLAFRPDECVLTFRPDENILTFCPDGSFLKFLLTALLPPFVLWKHLQECDTGHRRAMRLIAFEKQSAI